MFRNSDSSYRILLIIGEIFGFLSVILVQLFFRKNISYETYDWDKNPFSYHPLMMTLGLLFCYGNAIIVYRTFKQTSKYIVKLFHACLLLISLLFTVIGLIAIIRSKNLGQRSHLMTYHSWIGLITIILFILQWICGFISFLVPKLSLDFRQGYISRYRNFILIIRIKIFDCIVIDFGEKLYFYRLLQQY
jgi:cytochrome b-561